MSSTFRLSEVLEMLESTDFVHFELIFFSSSSGQDSTFYGFNASITKTAGSY